MIRHIPGNHGASAEHTVGADGLYPSAKDSNKGIKYTMALLAYMYLYDQRGGGVETSFKDNKQGLGSTTLTKNALKREAQQKVMLLGALAHNVVIWARHWLTQVAGPCKLWYYGMPRMVQDVFHVSGILVFDASDQIVQIVLNQAALLAPVFIDLLWVLLAPARVAINLGQT